MSKLFHISVRENRQVAEDHFLLTAHPLNKIQKPIPGQFFMLSVDNRLDPLLKRPFSLHRIIGGDLQFLYRVVGKATSILKEKQDGDIMDIIGPLGNGFPAGSSEEVKPVLVAGGIGLAPLLALAEDFAERKPLFFYGARTSGEILCIDELKSIGIDPIITTDDGTSGEEGVITDHLDKYLKDNLSSVTNCCIYACGPKPMLMKISKVAEKYKIQAYMAFEESMACGVGTCLGCIINTRDGYKRVCKEGPVFSSDDIVWRG